MTNKENHYVDNSKFFDEMCKWKEKVIEARNSGESNPPITEYIGECFLKISEKLSHRPNFANYPYREEMVLDGIENKHILSLNLWKKMMTGPSQNGSKKITLTKTQTNLKKM